MITKLKNLSWLLTSVLLVLILLLSTSNGQLFAQSNNMGINIAGSGGLDYNSDKPWADAMRAHRTWDKINSSVSADDATKDANYWPTQDARVLVWAGQQFNLGTYKLSFTGQATLVSNGGVISNKVYTTATNITTADLVISDPENDFLTITFTATKRTSTGATNKGVTNVKLMRPVTTGSNQSYATDKIFSDQFMTAIKKFSTIRFMDWTATNASEDIKWANRTKWTDARQLPPDLPHFRYNSDQRWQGRAASWESVILMANEANRDAWICVPHMADDDYITNLAALFKNGNEFTGGVGLKSNLKLYVEYSNEIWHYRLDFPQTETVQEMALASAATPGAPIKFDGIVDTATFTYRFKALRTVQISNIFRTAFGDNAMMTRIRPVLAWQQNYNDLTFRTLSFIDRYFNKRDSRSNVATPHPVNYFIWGGGGSTYYSTSSDDEDPPTTIDQVWNFGSMNPAVFYDIIKSDATFASVYGLNYTAYEGNADFYNLGDEDFILQVQTDPKMKQEIKEHQGVFNQLGGDLFCYFNTTGIGLGFEPFNLDNLTSPRFKALDELKVEAPKAVNYGPVPPFTRPGNSFDVLTYEGSRLGRTGEIDLTANDDYYAAGYAFHVVNDGPYKVKVQYATSASATLIIENNGIPVGTFNLANSNDASATTTEVTINCLKSKLQSIRVVCTSGEINIKNIIVSGNGNPLPPVNDVSTDIVYDNCNSNSGWTGSTIPTVSTSDKLEGTGSLAITGQSQGMDRKLTTPLNVSLKTYLKFWLFVSDVTKFTADNQIEITSSGRYDVNESHWRVANLGLVNGWNHVSLKLSEGRITGGAPDLGAINYFRIYTHTSASITLKVDNIRFSTNKDVPMDFCESATEWFGGLPVTRDTGEKKEGTSSLKSIGTHQDRFKKTFGTPIPTKVQPTTGYLKFWVFISDVTKFSGGGQVEISSSGTADVNEYNWLVSSLNLKNGWNYVTLKLSDARTTGGAANLGAINFFRFYQFMVAGAEVTTRIDDIRFSLDPPATAPAAREAYVESISMEEQPSKNSVSIFPVPAKDILIVHGNSTDERLSELRVISVGGTKVVYQERISRALLNNDHPINTQGLTSGMYILQLNHADGKTEQLKFSKE